MLIQRPNGDTGSRFDNKLPSKKIFSTSPSSPSPLYFSPAKKYAKHGRSFPNPYSSPPSFSHKKHHLYHGSLQSPSVGTDDTGTKDKPKRKNMKNDQFLTLYNQFVKDTPEMNEMLQYLGVTTAGYLHLLSSILYQIENKKISDTPINQS